MIQIYADGVLTYDSRLEEYDLLGLSVTDGLNKGGTATIVMPPTHPAYDAYIYHKTIVEIYRDNVLRFRGRALYPLDDVNNTRTITCEGELCFFLDTVSRPYLYQDSPENVFAAVIEEHNSQADPDKQFVIGEITVTDANDYIRLESEGAEQTLDTVNKLIERCGGYLVFTTNTDGQRVINWYATLGYRSSQLIEFGENLLNFSRTGANTDLVTAVLPYGAKNEETGMPVTIESVNDGVDFIVDDEAHELRGFIIRPVTWDDVTEPSNLLRKAREYLEQHRYIITALELSAVDLSYMDKSIDNFHLGDKIRVRSKPHRVDEDFLLTEYTEDLLNPANNSIVLGKEKTTLTDADVAGDKNNESELHKVTHQIKADYQLNTANAIKETERILSSLIQQTSQELLLEVSNTYLTNDSLTESISTSLKVLEDKILFEFNSLQATVDANDAEARTQFNEISNYISFANGAIKLGASDSTITLTIENDRIIFRKNGVQFGWWDGDYFHTGNIVIETNERAQFGNFAFIPRENGSLSFLKISAPTTNVTFTVTITTSGNPNFCYITHNGTKYYTPGETFTVKSGDVLSCYGYSGTNNVVYVNGSPMAIGSPVNYEYTVNSDINVEFTISLNSHSYIKITTK